MARPQKQAETSPYVSMKLSKSLCDKLDQEREEILKETGFRPGRAPFLKRILCERYNLPLTCVSEK